MFRVSFLDKSGKLCTASFPSRTIAEAYAKSVKKPTIEEIAGDAKPVQVQRIAEGTAEKQREASRAYYLQTARGELYVPPAVLAERAEEYRAEAMAEHFAEGAVRNVARMGQASGKG